ncbi:MAG: DUF503 domain-containing protein [Clostridiales bacterium]|jgi:uncharacterized protein YlxP (DUF503 family)|nr:DUF503 domain-containing protein [Clostridiales bacterium]
MVIGVCKIHLHINEVFSLKEKRRIVKSLTERLRARFNASIAEVELNDKWKNAVIGVACISNDGGHMDSILSSILNFIENDGRVFVADCLTEKIYVD